ncbi:MAG: hypothetical protein UX81_C0010G0007 [Parcubacteria group bacterium GW2011_GWA2_47_12]|nr:MAG: hypothetical protein UX81_C0010G0007 [Parcubacteria group bacterium GW2011_GWA2_47_12]
MSETQREKITKKALEVLANYQDGIRYSELLRELKSKLSNVPDGTIVGTLRDMHERNPLVAKPEKGLRILQRYLSSISKTYKTVNERTVLPHEESFYESFADYLVQNLEECTKAISLGGNRFGDRWGTPDVFGVYKFSEADSVRPPIEIISAEIKTDMNQLITAFGQACAYKIFSHKVYLVVPKEADTGRIESLCTRFGIGLILFNRNDSQDPKWEIRTRAVKNEPDYFYVNEYLQRLGDERRLLL